jgi:hypothetical protein
MMEEQSRVTVSGTVNAAVARLDWISGVGARAVRGAAVVAVVGALGSWVLIYPGLDGVRPLVFALSLAPAALLWYYARALDAAVTAVRVQDVFRDLVDKTTSQAERVKASLQTGRFRVLRGAFRAVRAARALRSDLDTLGVDVANWLIVGNPIWLVATAVAAATGVLLVMAAVTAGILRLVF